MASAAPPSLPPLIRTVFRGTNWSKLAYQPQPTRVYPSERIATLIPHDKPTWSVRSLLPTTGDIEAASREITREKLHHLLRLSALPLPKDGKQEDKMLETLRRQVHFVKQVQSVETEGVEPLVCIRDETAEYAESNTLGLEQMRPWLEREDVDRNRTVRMRKTMKKWWRTWDVFKLGKDCGLTFPRTQGRYFVVKRKGNRSDEEVIEAGRARHRVRYEQMVMKNQAKGGSAPMRRVEGVRLHKQTSISTRERIWREDPYK